MKRSALEWTLRWQSCSMSGGALNSHGCMLVLAGHATMWIYEAVWWYRWTPSFPGWPRALPGHLRHLARGGADAVCRGVALAHVALPALPHQHLPQAHVAARLHLLAAQERVCGLPSQTHGGAFHWWFLCGTKIKFRTILFFFFWLIETL